MIWLFVVVSVGLVVIIVQLLMVYQKRAHQIRLQQEPLRRRIRVHQRAMNEAVAKLHKTAARRLEELVDAADFLRGQSDALGEAIREAQDRASGTTEVEDAASGDTDPDILPGEKTAEELEKQARRETLYEATRRRDLMDSHIASLRRDLDIVRKTLERIEKRTSSAPAESEKGVGK